ncbi:hypothetical protein BC332_23911 [Capsicum chinense]|nr:hypothetical protein BC332_23911 [Capsicum chinense]
MLRDPFSGALQISSLCVSHVKSFEPNGNLIDNSTLNDAFTFDSFLYYLFAYHGIHSSFGSALCEGMDLRSNPFQEGKDDAGTGTEINAFGVAPLAYLAIYRVCNSLGFLESDILAAMDIAIEDGVNILSILLGGSSEPFHDDAIALVAYSAMEKGIFVCCSACNRGPTPRSMANEAPWILTVGANTFDRKINVTTVLINKEQFEGVDVKVEPSVLNFMELDHKMSYRVTFTQIVNSSSSVVDVEGFLKWKSTK